MRYPASEKIEIIRMVEESHLSVRRTLEKIGIARATFYRWYDLYQSDGPEALEDRAPRPSRVWNRIPDGVRDRILQLALDQSERRRGNWPYASPTRRATSCQRLRSTACSRRTT